MPSMEDDESISLFGFYACTAGWHEGHCHSCNGFWASVLVLALLVVVRAPLLISIGVDTLNTFLLWASQILLVQWGHHSIDEVLSSYPLQPIPRWHDTLPVGESVCNSFIPVLNIQFHVHLSKGNCSRHVHARHVYILKLTTSEFPLFQTFRKQYGINCFHHACGLYNGSR